MQLVYRYAAELEACKAGDGVVASAHSSDLARGSGEPSLFLLLPSRSKPGFL
jgi:hypothetical protein